MEVYVKEIWIIMQLWQFQMNIMDFKGALKKENLSEGLADSSKNLASLLYTIHG